MSEKDSFLKRLFGRLFSRGAKVPPMPEPEPEIIPEPPPPPPPRPVSKELWGKEFNLVDEGLAEEQVSEFVNDLTKKCTALEEQQKYFLSLGTLTERAAIEADKVAATTKAKIKSEAEAEAARIIAEANQRSQEMMYDAKKAAQEATHQEVQNILQAVLRKAAITELQAKQQAQLFLIRSRETIEGDLKEEIKEAYNRMLYGLQDLLGKGHQLELDWSEVTDQLRKRDTFDLQYFEVRTAALAGEIIQTPPVVATLSGVEAGMAEAYQGGEEAR